MKEPTAGIGARITQARQAKNYSLNKLATALGVHADTLADWEHNRTEPRAQKLMLLAGVLNVNMAWLLEGSDEFAPDPASPAAQRAAVKGEIAEIRRSLNGLADRLEALEGRMR